LPRAQHTRRETN